MNMSLIMSSSNYFDLYSYNDSDLVLSVSSFLPDALETAIADTLQLIKTI